MAARNSLIAVAAFLVVLAGIVGAAGLAGTVAGGGDDAAGVSPPSVDTAQYGDRVTPVPEEGRIELDSATSGKTVLVDTVHENAVSDAELQPLVDALVRNGHEVRFTSPETRDLNASLREADALLVVNPVRRYSADQAAGVRAFAEAGGRVVVLSDPPATRITGGLFSLSVERVGGKTTSLASPLGVAFGSSGLYHATENANNYEDVYATPGEGPIAAGVNRVVLREATPVVHDANGTTALSTVEGTTLESTRRSDTYAVAATNGNVTAVGDSDFLAASNVYDADNEVLAGNLADFLVTGDKTSGAPAAPEAADGPGGPTGPPGRTGPTPPGGAAPTPPNGSADVTT
jgi:hypothetical protein